jgi:hypothetical protein
MGSMDSDLSLRDIVGRHTSAHCLILLSNPSYPAKEMRQETDYFHKKYYKDRKK